MHHDSVASACRLPSRPPQRRRFSSGDGVGQVYAWAQLALLQGICPTMDAHLVALQQQPPRGAASDNSDAGQTAQPQDGSSERNGSSIDGSGATPDGEAIVARQRAAVAATIAARTAADAAARAALPAERDDDWVQRWADAAGSSTGWAWHGGWRLVQTYPRREVPRGDDGANDGTEHGGSTVAEAGLAPQAALAVEKIG